MIKHLIKILWAQRKINGWIFCELAVVMCVVWLMTDKMWVDTRCYLAPLGYDIENTWRLRLATLSPSMEGYVEESPEESLRNFHTLVDRIEKEPEVEGTCLSFWSMPYSYGNSWRNIFPVDGDTARTKGHSFHSLVVTPDYFTLFRIRDREGREIAPMLEGVIRPAILTIAGERFFFGETDARGREVSENADFSYPYTVAGVLPTFRSNDFDRPENCLFFPLDEGGLNGTLGYYGAENVELCVRMRKQMTEDEMLLFLEQAADRLVEGNLFVQSVESVSAMRDTQLSFKRDAMMQRVSIVLFLSINVFFGVVGTFWLRTERRRGEIGLRMAIGADRGKISSYLFAEGILLLLLTLPLVFLFVLNLSFSDNLDTYRESLSILRLAATFGLSYLLMALMIGLGIWLPAHKALELAPAEALRYE